MKTATFVVCALRVGSMRAWRVDVRMRQEPPALPARDLRTLDEVRA